jgi:hypothetical protein
VLGVVWVDRQIHEWKSSTEMRSWRSKGYSFLGVDELGGLHGWINGVLLHFCPF